MTILYGLWLQEVKQLPKEKKAGEKIKQLAQT